MTQKWNINPDGMTVQELKELTGYGESTIRQWAIDFDIPSARRNGRTHIFMPEAQEIFKQIIELKNEGFVEKEILAKLKGEPERHDVPDVADGHFQMIIAQAVDQAFERQVTLAKSYAQATYQIGKLENQVDTLQLALAERDEKLRLLPDKLSGFESENRVLEFQVKTLKSELTTTSEKLADLNRHVDAMTLEGKQAQKQLEAINQSVMTLQNEKNDLAKQLESRDKKINALESEGDELRQAIQAKDAESVELKARIEQLEIELQAEKNKSVLAKIFGK